MLSLDFMPALDSFLSALFAFINDLLNTIFASLAGYFNGLAV